MCSTGYLVFLWRRKSHLLQDSGSNHNGINSIISFHKIKALVSSKALVKPGAMHKCEDCVPVKVLSPQQRTLRSLLMSPQIFCAAAVNSSCGASTASNFTRTLSGTVEVLWRVWKRVFSYGISSLWWCSSKSPALKSPFTSFLLKKYLFQPQQGYWKCSVSECDLQLRAASASSVSAKENEISAE